MSLIKKDIPKLELVGNWSSLYRSLEQDTIEYHNFMLKQINRAGTNGVKIPDVSEIPRQALAESRNEREKR